MNILYVIPNLEIGGAEKYVVTISNRLSRKGHKVFICTIGMGGGLKDQLNKKVKYINLGHDTNIGYKKVKRLARIINENNIDVVHSHLYKGDILNFLTSFITRNKVKRFSTEHSSSSRRKKYKIFGYIQKILYLRFNGIIAISESVKQHLCSWAHINPKRVLTVYNGIEGEIVDDEYVNNKYSTLNTRLIELGTISRLEVRKDLKTALNGIALLINEFGFNNFRYTIYGDGPDRKELEKYVIDLEIEENVNFFGFTKNISKYIDKMDLHILTSIEEGFGLVIIETMARGVPNIATRVGGIPEIIDNNQDSLLINKADYVGLAKKIYSILNNEPELSRLAINSKEKVRSNFLIETNIEKIFFLYQNALNGEDNSI